MVGQFLNWVWRKRIIGELVILVVMFCGFLIRHSVLDKLNKYSNSLIVLVTTIYVIFTYFILRESKADRLNQKMPVVVLRFRHKESEGVVGEKIAEERMVNIGSGPALDIQIETNGVHRGGSVEGFNENDKLISMSSIFPVDNVLGPDNGDPDMQICFLISMNGISVLKNPKAIFKVTYKDVFGRRYETLFRDCKNSFKQL